MIEFTLKANRVGHVRISDDPMSADEGDIRYFSNDTYARILCDKPGKSYEYDFIWGKGEVRFDGDPVIAAGESIDVTIFFRNNRTFNDPKHLRLRWLLPDGFTVSGGRRDLYLPHLSMHSDATASVTFTITAGEHVDAVNRTVLEVIAQGRPTAGYLPVVLLG
jgi:hypothetical protein